MKLLKITSPVTLSFFILIAAITGGPLSAAQKKVLVLDFVNIENNPEAAYLSSSLTDAVKKKLKELFAFKEPDRAEWQMIAEENYLYESDFYTKSVAMNLGLLSGQDVVISGAYRITDGRKPQIITEVRILDIPEKEVIAGFTEKGPADNRIFDTVDRIAVRISKEAKAVLPTKEEWERGAGPSAPSGPVFDNFMLTAGAGGALYALDYAENIEAQQPAFRFSLRANVPAITDDLTMSTQLLYMNDKPSEGQNPAIEGLNINTTSFMPGLYFGYNINIGPLYLHPRLGGGYVLQSITVTGARNEDLTNSMPFAGGGFDIGYRITRTLDIALSLDVAAQLENGNTTLANLATLGVAFRL